MSNTVIGIVAEYLRSNGYGGLCNAEGCGCELDDLEPCGNICADCTAGYKHIDPQSPGDWIISRKPEPPTDDEWELHRVER